MTKFKVGDKVRVAVSEEFVPKGTILTVTKGPVGSARGGNYYFEGYPQTDNYCVLGGDLALAFEKPTKNQRITTLEQNVVSLESEVAELKAKVEALEKAQKPSYQIGVDFARPSPNEQRKAIIAEAKAFVTELIDENGVVQTKGITYPDVLTNPHFVVNADKRTVTVVLKGIHSGIIYAKAIAKCAPDDVFNADIGKAIALGRALGLDVSRFEQAVKPTEVVVGQVVNISNSIGSKDGAKVYAFANGAAGSPGILVTQFYGNRSDGFTWVRTDDAKQITDDTEAKY